MRILPLDGPRARYERIRLLEEAADYGLRLDPQATAPFTVRWNSSRKLAEVCVRHTVLAYVNVLYASPRLHVRDAYPEDQDNALLRAIRNAADLADQIGRLQRANARLNRVEPQKIAPDALLVKARDATEFSLDLGRSDITKAAYGAMTLPDVSTRSVTMLGRRNERLRIVVSNGDDDVSFDLMHHQGTFRYEPKTWPALQPTRAGLLRFLDAGRAAWDCKADPKAFSVAARALISGPTFDEDTLTTTWRVAHDRKQTVQNATATQGPFTMQHAKFASSGSDQLRFKGILMTEESTKLMGVPETEREQVDNLMLHYTRAAELGLSLEDFPAINPMKIRQMVEGTDFGYDI